MTEQLLQMPKAGNDFALRQRQIEWLSANHVDPDRVVDDGKVYITGRVLSFTDFTFDDSPAGFTKQRAAVPLLVQPSAFDVPVEIVPDWNEIAARHFEAPPEERTRP